MKVGSAFHGGVDGGACFVGVFARVWQPSGHLPPGPPRGGCGELQAAVTPRPPFQVTSIIRSQGGAGTLTWGSFAGANYQVMPSAALESGLATISLDIAGTATATATDSAVPANATRRFYNTARTR